MLKKLTFLLFLLFSLFNFAQLKDSVAQHYIKQKFEFKKLIVPSSLLIGGLITQLGREESISNEIVEERNEHLFGFTNHIDDYAQFSPFVAIYAFDIAGMKAKTDWQNRTAILIKGQIFNLGTVYLLKKAVNNTRPDGTQFSFPSGHTANVFAGATMLSMEYGEEYKWVPYVSYSVASGVGVMRMLNNKHYISDVLFGAGLGILSMKIAYWTHQYKWNKPKNTKDPFDKMYPNPEL